ncbi:hypothetical protein P3G67_13440 [Streptomyces sp. RB6PN23]|uniref:Uncharacterized protein n=1 Tax=Streptomyces silvisoli TaxID=3034235 RepID=A0ABT5ZK74_9ACTN|nr:hypothetical protein [Streptomyces silvisoli]MDF3290232.1 hypothetical protein [Streptomyces silvisoli]
MLRAPSSLSAPSAFPRSGTHLSPGRIRDRQLRTGAVHLGRPLAEPDGGGYLRKPREGGARRGLSPLPPAPNAGAQTATSPAKDRETVWCKVAFGVAPNTVNRVTTATPVSSAVAVAAVRLGPRSALHRASARVTPRSRASAAPSTRTA